MPLLMKNVALSEDFLLMNHFPLKPIMPAVLIIEGMAQLSGLLLEEGVRKETGRNLKALMSIIEKAKFRRPVYPGDTLIYRAEVDSINEVGGRDPCGGPSGMVNWLPNADWSLLFMKMNNPHLESRRSEILSLWMKGLKSHETE